MNLRGSMTAGVLGLIVASGFAAAPAAAADKVIFGTVGAFNENYAPMFVARELGYFDKEKIELEVVNFGGATTLLPQIAANRVTVGFPNAEPLIQSRSTCSTSERNSRAYSTSTTAAVATAKASEEKNQAVAANDM